MNEANKKTIPISTIVIVIILIVAGYIGYHCYDNYKWKKYDEEHKKTDNLLSIECYYDEELENVVSCNIGTSEKTSEYESLSISIKHNSNIKYISHYVPSETKIYNSHEVTISGYDDNVNERYYISGFDEIEDLPYLLNMKYEIIEDESLDNTLSFDYMTIIKDDIYHYNDKIVINLADYKEKANADEIKSDN